MAATMYQNENRVYPAANYNPAAQSIFPNQLQDRLINDLAPYLGSRPVAGTEVVTALPQTFVCPFRLQSEVFDAPFTGTGPVYWFTGYDYYGWLADTPNDFAVVLKPERVADPRATVRGVLWGDTIARSTFYGPAAWIYFHFRGYVRFNGIGAADTSALSGQHRAWSDGSVEWIDGSEIDANPADLDTSASFKDGPPGNYYNYVWF